MSIVCIDGDGGGRVIKERGRANLSRVGVVGGYQGGPRQHGNDTAEVETSSSESKNDDVIEAW